MEKSDSYENVKNETAKVVNAEKDKTQPAEEMTLLTLPVPEVEKPATETAPAVFVPKHKYAEDGGSADKPVIPVSLREEVKLNEVDSPWKPTRFRKYTINEEEHKTQELYEKFRGILNKLTLQKFDTLLDKVKTLDINNQQRLEGVIDLVFEKAIDEPIFSEAYAAMCNKLSALKVPADNPTSYKWVNFRALIINKCQTRFETHKTEQVLKLEKDLAECTDSTKTKELSLKLEEENRKVRMRSIGNVKFIGELYKLKMLSSKIIEYCMKNLIENLEEEKLECLCKLLTTIGDQAENVVNRQLDNIFKTMQDIVDQNNKSNKISSRVRFMLQDVIELRRRNWIAKTVIEAKQHQHTIELMNANLMANFRDGRRQNSNNAYMYIARKTRTNYTVNKSKLKAVTQRNLNNIKIAPHHSAWNHGSGSKNTAQASSNSMTSLSKNMYSVLENMQSDNTTLRGSVKLSPNPDGGSADEPVIPVSLREEVKLNEVDSPWKPTRFRKYTINEEEHKTQELYEKFRGILNKLTPQKFDTLLDKVKTLDINNQQRLEGVIDLVFEKAIDEPIFSEAYAAMFYKLSVLKVPADNPTSYECVNFRALYINKCRTRFETHKTEQVLKLEKDLAECTDSTKTKELSLMLEEENRKVRMRSIGNVKFIGELYKLKMLTSKIIEYCMKNLIENLEEEKLECLCKLLTTIGDQAENVVNRQLDNIFKTMQDIVDQNNKSNKISSRVRFMLQDVIELRRRNWIAKTVIEAKQHQHTIELMNANLMANFRDGRRQNSNNAYMYIARKTRTNYTVNKSKLKAVTQRNLNNIKIAPHHSAWNHGSGTKNTAQASSNSMTSLSKNMYSVLENMQSDNTTLRASGGEGGSSGSMRVARAYSGTRTTNAAPSIPPIASENPAAPAPIPQEPLPEAKKKSVKSMIDLSLIYPNDEKMVAEVKIYQPQYHAAVVTQIFKICVEKTPKEAAMIAKPLLLLLTTNTISVNNFIDGMKDVLEYAPDYFIDIPMLYDSLGKLIAPQIEKKHITFTQIFRLCVSIISENHGHLFLKCIVKELIDSMGPSFVKSQWQESGLQVSQWMDEKQVEKWMEDNKFEFFEGVSETCEDVKKILSPAQTQSKLIQLANADESCDCIKGWVQDKFGKTANEDWFMRALIQAICEHSLFGPEGRDVPHFSQDRLNKYASLIHDFGETKQSREASCLFGIQQLLHRLDHPQGLTLEIFQYLHEQYIISLDGFLEWEKSEKEPEGKDVMLKALTSFFTNKEADNGDSCSED